MLNLQILNFEFPTTQAVIAASPLVPRSSGKIVKLEMTSESGFGIDFLRLCRSVDSFSPDRTGGWYRKLCREIREEQMHKALSDIFLAKRFNKAALFH